MTTKGVKEGLRRQFFPFGKYNIGKRCTEAGGTNWEIDAGTLKNDVPASIIFRRRANKRADVRRQ